MNKEKLLKIVIPVLCVVVLLGFLILKKSNKVESYTVVSRGDMVEATYAVGTVKADKVFNLKTGVNTKMIERFVRVGQKVKKGQPLIRLDSFPIYTAPFDGVVTVLNYEVGELVFSSSVVLTLVSEDKLYLELSLDERSIHKVKVGNDAKIFFEGQKGNTSGKVRSIFSNADQFYVHLDFNENNLVLLPGMTCDVSLITKKYEKVKLVPLEAINYDSTVRLKNNSNKNVKLNILYRNDKFAVIGNDEINEGDTLIFAKDTKAPSLRKSSPGAGH